MAALGALLVLGGCSTMRGRADDALQARDYRKAAALYTKVLAENPDDPEVKRHLIEAEQGMIDEALVAVALKNKAGHTSDALVLGLYVMTLADKVRPESLDDARRRRIATHAEWASSTIRSTITADTTVGRALAARTRRAAFNDWLARRELGSLGSELDAQITESGHKTCARATTHAGDAPFTLELVATYCKAFGAPLPAWKPRPFVVGSFAFGGTIEGVPSAEIPLIEEALVRSARRSVWFSSAAEPRAAIDVHGEVAARFTRRATELTRPWVEQVPYQTTETYQDPVQRSYQDTESYTETVPYTAYQNGKPVTQYRTVTRTRPVTRFRTEWVTRSRVVTRFRDEARTFTFKALKHEARYSASSVIRVNLGSALKPVVARESKENSAVAFEHDAEFPPAGVHPEQAVLTNATDWRAEQRERMARALLSALDAAWTESFCGEELATLEEVARCVHGRPNPAPAVARIKVSELFEDDAMLVLALPRPQEGT